MCNVLVTYRSLAPPHGSGTVTTIRQELRKANACYYIVLFASIDGVVR